LSFRAAESICSGIFIVSHFFVFYRYYLFILLKIYPNEVGKHAVRDEKNWLNKISIDMQHIQTDFVSESMNALYL